MVAKRASTVAGLLAGAGLAVTMGAAARAADIKPALIYDIGGKFDKSFNEGAFHGAEKFKEDTGIAFRDFEIQNDTQREQAMRKFARDGLSPIIAIGFSQASAMEKVAAEFPKTQFVIVDMVVDKPNVQSVVFKEQEGSWSGFWPPRLPRPARSVSSVAWTFRSSTSSPAATCRA